MRATLASIGAMIMTLALAATADAGSVANDSPFCAKKEELIALARATAEKDVNRMMELVNDGTCMVLNAKTEATLVSKHDDGSIVEVRLSKRGKTLEGFALAEDFVE